MLIAPQLRYSTAAKVLITSAIAYQVIPKVFKSYYSTTMLVPPQAPPSWNHTPEQILKETESYITNGKQLHDKIGAIDQPTIENSFKPFAEFDNENAGISNILTFYQHVSASKELRDVHGS